MCVCICLCVCVCVCVCADQEQVSSDNGQSPGVVGDTLQVRIQLAQHTLKHVEEEPQ